MKKIKDFATRACNQHYLNTRDFTAFKTISQSRVLNYSSSRDILLFKGSFS